MEALIAIDKILALPVVRWLLLISAVVAVGTATWCKIQIGTVRLQRDAAMGQVATFEAHLNVQNEAIRKANQEASEQHKKMSDATAKADSLQKAADKWRKEAGKTRLTGDCTQMVDQVIASVKGNEDAK